MKHFKVTVTWKHANDSSNNTSEVTLSGNSIFDVLDNIENPGLPEDGDENYTYFSFEIKEITGE